MTLGVSLPRVVLSVSTVCLVEECRFGSDRLGFSSQIRVTIRVNLDKS